jgi:hypothetical protein
VKERKKGISKERRREKEREREKGGKTVANRQVMVFTPLTREVLALSLSLSSPPSPSPSPSPSLTHPLSVSLYLPGRSAEGETVDECKFVFLQTDGQKDQRGNNSNSSSSSSGSSSSGSSSRRQRAFLLLLLLLALSPTPITIFAIVIVVIIPAFLHAAHITAPTPAHFLRELYRRQ